MELSKTIHERRKTYHMSCKDFITSILNIDSSKIKSLDTIQHSDTSIDVFITLNEVLYAKYCVLESLSSQFHQKHNYDINIKLLISMQQFYT